MNRNQLALIFSLLFFFTSCSQGEKATNQGSNTTTGGASTSDQQTTSGKLPPADVVRASADAVEVKAGGSGEANVKLIVASGYHINANPPSFPYLKATEITVEPGDGLTPGKPVYPQSVTRKFAFSKDPLAVYEGETAIKLPLSAESSAQKGSHTLKGKLRIQACDEEACYPPRTIDTSIPVTIK